ncbi:hypothetical protein, partial [Escherichia coli]|uniref:hypothetical protein n=1 Tax=Escherichia coli TaxID=562 RepID=UPI001BC88154
KVRCSLWVTCCLSAWSVLVCLVIHRQQTDSAICLLSWELKLGRRLWGGPSKVRCSLWVTCCLSAWSVLVCLVIHRQQTDSAI